ncbi:response regulator transcription factor [Clostridium grantii]|uniref:Stage 0 sporulation protein A homolog n=1 Tax=Clostridium grantii DSM 8605 TaxID=1121316 RepID=A0A1M5TSI5_9CLOT|nr:response regulator [Clostridium grantii]SHH53620.1 two component transcriptional regulator, AraC family [Clostridium grantii DSM 8605]
MKKLLIVDDEGITREYIRYVVSENHEDVEIKEAKNGNEAIEKIKEFSPDLVLMDIRMPELDGIKALEKIRKFDMNVKVAILTAHDEFSYAQKSVKLNAIDYLLKPISPEDLLDFIDTYLYESDDGSASNFGVVTQLPEDKHVADAKEYINNNYDKKIYLNDVAEHVGFSPYYFSRLFKKSSGMNLSEYINRFRIEKAKEFMTNSSLSLKEISEKAGYEDFSYFSTVFQRYEKCLPSKYRKSLRK